MSSSKALQELIKQYSLVDPASGCWNWAKSLSHGYGYIKRKSLPDTRAHRLAYMAFNELVEIPTSLCVCHTCDNRACVNPVHLTLQTKTWNNQDKVRKGRARTCNGQHINVGEMHPAAKLSSAAIAAIRASNESQTKLAAIYGVTQSAISRIKSHNSWRHI